MLSLNNSFCHFLKRQVVWAVKNAVCYKYCVLTLGRITVDSSENAHTKGDLVTDESVKNILKVLNNCLQNYILQKY